MKPLIAVCSSLLAAVVTQAAPPTISFSTEDVGGNETILLCGDSFNRPSLEVLRWLPPQAESKDWASEPTQRASLERVLKVGTKPPLGIPERSARLVVSDVSENTCAALLPADGFAQVQILYARSTEGAAPPWTINRPKIWLTVPEFPAPGSRLRLLGRNLFSQITPGPTAWLRDSSGKLQRLVFGWDFQIPFYDKRLVPPYEIDVELPEHISGGDYEIFVHNGSGGDFGWSAPVPVRVRAPRPGPTLVVKAADHGAIPDDEMSDSEALDAALAAAAAAPDGGIVQLAPGTYHLSRSLKLPPKTILRGAGLGATALATLHNAHITPDSARSQFPEQDRAFLASASEVLPMVWLPEHCALEHLSFRGAPETLCVLIGRRGSSGPDIALRSCAIVNRNPVWFRGGQWRRGNCVLIAGATERLEIRDCLIEGSSPIGSGAELLRRATITGNTLMSFPQGRSDPAVFRKPMECVIEHNRMLNSRRGIVIQPAGMAVHNLVANNLVEHTERGKNAGEVELWEGGTVAAGGKIKAADTQSLTAHNPQWVFVDRKGTKRDLRGDTLVGYVCLIIRGRGMGQHRFVSRLKDDTLTLDRPWDVIPAAGSEFVVTTSSIENLILNNTDRDGDAGMQFWGGTIANVISGHISDDTEGLILEAADQRKVPGSLADLQHCWFNDIRLCRFERGARLQLWPGRRPDAAFDDAGPLLFGNSVRESMWGDSPRLPHQNQWGAFWEQKHFHHDGAAPLENHIAIRLAVKGNASVGDPDDLKWNALTSAASTNVIERNFIDVGWPVGMYETRSARGNIFRENQIGAAKPAVRRGETKAP
jgi:Pectate lyase superfamily protein